MSARNEPSQLPALQRFLDLIKTRQSADKLHVIEEFPKFMVRCFLKSPEYGNIQPFYEQKFMHKFYLNKESWDLLECLDCMPDSRCRFSFQHSDPVQNSVIENIKRYNTCNSQLTRPPELTLEEHLKPQDMSAIDMFLVSFCSGLREAYCLEGGCCLDLKFQKDFRALDSDSQPEAKLDFAAHCKQKKPLPDSISCDPSYYLKSLIDNFLKPNSADAAEKRSYKERAFARLCSLLIWVFKDAKHTSADDSGIIRIRQNALLVPLCFLPLVSVVCHKMLNLDVNKNRKFPCLTDQNGSDNRKTRPRHSLMGYSAVTPKISSSNPNNDMGEFDTSHADLWKKFLPSAVADDNCFPSQFFHFTKMSQADAKYWKEHNDYGEGRYISLLSHYVHLLLEAVRADYPNKKNMYSIHFDNLISTIWASTMFPWMITQKPAEPEVDQRNIPFRRDFEKLHCQIVPYLYDDMNPKAPCKQMPFDDPERFSLSFTDEIQTFIKKQILIVLRKCQAQASERKCYARCSQKTIGLLILLFSLPWIQFHMGNIALCCFLAAGAYLLADILLVAYFLWQNLSAPQTYTFSQMIRQSTDAFFLHRWATDYSQWTMKSEHNLLASQAMFFEYLSRRLKEDAQDFKGALAQPGYIQWIDTLECIFHDSTASFNWACCADSAFLKRSFSEVFEHASQSLNQAFVPAIVCIVPDEHAQRVLCDRRPGENSSRIQELSSFFRHHLRVGIIAESHFNRKQELLDQVTDLTPFLKLFNFHTKSHHQYGPEFERNVENLKKIFGNTLDTKKSKTIAIIPAISVKKTRQFMIEQNWNLVSSRTPNSSDDFLDALCVFKNKYAGVITEEQLFYVVIGLKNVTGKVIMARVDLQNITKDPQNIFCKNVIVWDKQDHPAPDWSVWCKSPVDVFLYAVDSTILFLDSNDDDISFDFAKCLCSSSRPSPPTSTKERFQTIVKQGHSFSDKLTFKISSHSSQLWDALLEYYNKRSHEYIISDSSGKELLLQSLRSPWVSRPAFPRPTLGSPFFLLFLMSKPGCRPGRPGEYLIDLKKEDFDMFSKSLRQLGSALDDTRKSTISKLDPDILKQNSFLLFKWQQFVNSMPWIGYERIPPRDVLFRTRVCSSNIKDVAWWLSSSEIVQASSITTSLVSNVSLQSSVTSSINAEVKNLKEEVCYLLRLQKLIEVTILHLKMCRSALDQCIKVHNDPHLGHVQFWELLNHWRTGSNLSVTDRSRLKHICRQYLEKVSNLILLAGIPVKQPSPSFDAISRYTTRIKYTAFRDQMMYHFKDSWNTTGRTWTDSIHASVTSSSDTSHCCCGNLDLIGSDWTKDAGILFQDILGRLHDHSCGLFPQGSKSASKSDPIKQAGILKLINAYRGSLDFITFSSFLPHWDCESSENRSFLDVPDISSHFGIFATSTPFEFLEHLRQLLHEIHESLNSDMVASASFITIHNLQDAILFMSERDVDGNDSSSPGILQILQDEWAGVADLQRKPGLAGDLETTHRLVEQRLKTCQSKILTLTGKQKRAQLIRDDPSYRQGQHAPQDAVRLLIWRILDWYSQQFNDCWGFPTTCVLDSRSNQEGICHAIHSNHRYLAFFPEHTANQISQRHPNFDKVLCALYIGILSIWFHSFSLKIDLWFFSFSLFFLIIIALVRNRGRVNLPYILATLRIIDRDDVHHGTALLDLPLFSFLGLCICLISRRRHRSGRLDQFCFLQHSDISGNAPLHE